MDSLRSRTVVNAKWTLGAAILTALLQVAFGIILARILGPAAFGLMDLTNVVITFSNYFVRMGIGPALVQAQNLTDQDINFAFTFSIFIGSLISALVILSSSTIAAFFLKPELGPILQMTGISLFLTALSSVVVGLLQRQMEFKKIVITETIGFILGSGFVSVGLAYLGYGVWSLVVGLIVNRLVQLTLAFFVLRYRFRPNWNLRMHDRLVRFGTQYSINSLLEYFSANLDTVTVGRFFSAAQVGLYTTAYSLANLPTQLLVSSFTRVLFPALSKLQSDRQKMKAAQLELLAFVGALSMAICLGMIPAAKQIVFVLLGAQWLGCVLAFQILLLAVPFDFMAHVFALTFDAAGELKRKSLLQLFTVLFLIAALAVLWRVGIWGVGLAITLSSIVHLGMYIIQNQRVLAVPISASLKVILGSSLIGVTVLAGIGIVSLYLGHLGFAPVLTLSVEIVVGGTIALAFFYTHVPDVLGLTEMARLGARTRSYVRNWLGWENA